VDLANASNAVRDVLQNARDPDTARNILSRYKLSGKAYSLAVSQLGGQFKGLVGDAPISGDPALAGIGDQGFTGPGLNGDYRSFMSKLENASGNPNAKRKFFSLRAVPVHGRCVAWNYQESKFVLGTGQERL